MVSGVTLSFANQKGGVAKTTSAAAIASIFGLQGIKVLVVDGDPQGNMSVQLGFDYEQGKGNGTTSHLYQGTAQAHEIAWQTNFKGVALIPAKLDLSEVEMTLPALPGCDVRLRAALEGAKSLYDIIIIDSPPNLGKLAINVLNAADWYIVPVDGPAALSSVETIQKVVKTNAKFYPYLKSDFLGIFMTMTDRTSIMNSVREEAESRFPGKVFKAEIRRSTLAKEAFAVQQPLPVYEPSSPITKDYKALGKEIAIKMGFEIK